jgi:hypothetical protein
MALCNNSCDFKIIKLQTKSKKLNSKQILINIDKTKNIIIDVILYSCKALSIDDIEITRWNHTYCMISKLYNKMIKNANSKLQLL